MALALSEQVGDGAQPARIDRADARAVLDRLAGTGLIEGGSVCVISVHAIRERTGARWSRRREDVWAYVRRKCDEHLSQHDLRQQINETDFLVVMTADEGLAAQAVSLKILREVLLFFLGAVDPSDIRVQVVTEVHGDVLSAADVKLSAGAASRSAKVVALADHKPDAREVGRRNPVSFVTACGERVRVDFALERVVSLRHDLTAAHRIQPSVTLIRTGAVVPASAFPTLADEDIAFIDRATFDFAVLHIPADARATPPLIVPASFRTMGGRKGRSTLIGHEGVTPLQVRDGVIVELTDVDVGTPTARLAEVTGLVGQLSRGVMARIWPKRDALAPVRGVRLQGLSFDVRELALDEARLGALLVAMGAQIRGGAAMALAQGLPDPGWMQQALRAGFSHAALAAD